MSRARDLAAFVSNADGDIKFDTDTLFIDSSANRVGIGETTPARQLHVDGSEARLVRLSHTSHPKLEFLDTTDGTSGAYLGSEDNELTFDTNGQNERMRIDDSGNVGIGTSSPDGRADIAQDQNTTKFTSPHLALTATDTTNTTGFTGVSYGVSGLTNYGWTAGALRGTSGNNSAFVFTQHNNSASGTEKIRLTSNGLTFNGDTAAANALSDYEEGNFTASLVCAGGSIAINPSYNRLVYTKIGSLVMLTGRFRLGTVSSPTGSTYLDLPFTVANDSEEAGFSSLTLYTYRYNVDADALTLFCELQPNTTKAFLMKMRDDNAWAQITSSGFSAGDIVYINGCYKTSQ